MEILELMDDDSMDISTKLNKWEDYINSDIINNNITTIRIDPVTANRYIGDFYGLLHNVLNIPNVAYYINMRINNIHSSLDYDGFLDIKIINSEIIETIIDMME